MRVGKGVYDFIFFERDKKYQLELGFIILILYMKRQNAANRHIGAQTFVYRNMLLTMSSNVHPLSDNKCQKSIDFNTLKIIQIPHPCIPSFVSGNALCLQLQAYHTWRADQHPKA